MLRRTGLLARLTWRDTENLANFWCEMITFVSLASYKVSSKWYQESLRDIHAQSMLVVRSEWSANSPSVDSFLLKIKGNTLGTLVVTIKIKVGGLKQILYIISLWSPLNPLSAYFHPLGVPREAKGSFHLARTIQNLAIRVKFESDPGAISSLLLAMMSRKLEHRAKERDESKGGIGRPASLFKEQAKIKHACINLECQSRRRSLLLSPYLWYQRSAVRLPGFPVFGLSSEAEPGVSRMYRGPSLASFIPPASLISELADQISCVFPCCRRFLRPAISLAGFHVIFSILLSLSLSRERVLRHFWPTWHSVLERNSKGASNWFC